MSTPANMAPADPIGAAPRNAKPEPPIIEPIVRRPGGHRTDLKLWPNPDKNISDEQFDALTPQQQVKFAQMRDLQGYVTVSHDGRDHVIKVSVWIHEEQGQTPRLKIMGDLNSQQGMMGSVRAMTRYKGAPADGRLGLRLIGDLDVHLQGERHRITVSGQVTRAYRDRELMLDAARVFGFPEAMIESFSRRLDDDATAAADRARGFVADQGTHHSSERRMVPA